MICWIDFHLFVVWHFLFLLVLVSMIYLLVNVRCGSHQLYLWMALSFCLFSLVFTISGWGGTVVLSAYALPVIYIFKLIPFIVSGSILYLRHHFVFQSFLSNMRLANPACFLFCLLKYCFLFSDFYFRFLIHCAELLTDRKNMAFCFLFISIMYVWVYLKHCVWRNWAHMLQCGYGGQMRTYRSWLFCAINPGL